MNKFLFVLICILRWEGVFAQTVIRIQGILYDSLEKKPLVGNVYLNQGDRTVSFTTSNADGKFEIQFLKPIKCEYTLAFKSFGYTPITIETCKLKHSIIRVALSTSSQELPQVKVSAIWRIRQHKDTLEYNANYYQDITNKKIAGMLKNIPGMEVANNGKISFNGRDIKHLLIEGDNMAGEDYGAIVNNLNSDYVSSIQLIKNYNENRVLGEFQGSGDFAISLKIKERNKGKLNVNGSVGISSLHPIAELENNILHLKNKSRILVLDGFNKSGIPYNLTTNSLPEQLKALVSNAIVSTDVLNDKFLLDNESYLGKIMLVNGLGAKVKLNTEIKLSSDYFNSQTSIFEDFHTNGLNYFLQQTSQMNIREKKLKCALNAAHDNSKNFASNFSLSFYGDLVKKKLSVENSGALNNLEEDISKLKSSLLNINYKAAIRTRNKNVWVIDVLGRQISFPFNKFINTNKLNSYWNLADLQISSIIQRNMLKQNSLSLKTGYKINNNSKYDIDTFMEYTDFKVSGGIYLRDSIVKNQPFKQSNLFEMGLNLGYMQKFEHWKIISKAKFGSINYQTPSQHLMNATFILSQSFEFANRKNRNWLFKIWANRNLQNIYEYLYDTLLIESNKVQYRFDPNRMGISYGSELTYSQNIFEAKGRFSISSILTNNFEQTLNQQIIPGLEVISSNAFFRKPAVMFFMVGDVYSFLLKSKINFEINYYSSNLNSFINGQSAMNHYKTTSAKIGLTSNFQSPFRFQYCFMPSFQMIELMYPSNKNSNIIFAFKNLFKLLYNPSNKGYVGCEIFGEQIGVNSNWSSKLQCGFNFKKIGIEFKCLNFFNNKEVVTKNISTTNSTVIFQRAIPLNLIFKINY